MMFDFSENLLLAWSVYFRQVDSLGMRNQSSQTLASLSAIMLQVGLSYGAQEVSNYATECQMLVWL